MWTAPPASAAAGALSPEITAALSNMASLQRLWAGVLASLKKSKAAYGVLFMNTKGAPEGITKAFIDYIYTPEGTEIIKKSGYIPTGRQ